MNEGGRILHVQNICMKSQSSTDGKRGYSEVVVHDYTVKNTIYNQLMDNLLYSSSSLSSSRSSDSGEGEASDMSVVLTGTQETVRK